MTPYDLTVRQYCKMLLNLDAWLERAVAHAKAKNFDPAVLLAARLAPDQFAFARQVQAACDQAKYGVARLSGREAPKHPDTETTIDELRVRIASVVAWIAEVTPADFAGAEARALSLPHAQGMTISGADYLVEMNLPNFYFHLTTAYAILRHNGVDLGKRDFLGQLSLKPA